MRSNNGRHISLIYGIELCFLLTVRITGESLNLSTVCFEGVQFVQPTHQPSTSENRQNKTELLSTRKLEIPLMSVDEEIIAADGTIEEELIKGEDEGENQMSPLLHIEQEVLTAIIEHLWKESISPLLVAPVLNLVQQGSVKSSSNIVLARQQLQPEVNKPTVHRLTTSPSLPKSNAAVNNRQHTEKETFPKPSRPITSAKTDSTLTSALIISNMTLQQKSATYPTFPPAAA